MDLLIAYGLPLLIANVIHQFVIIPRNFLPALSRPLDGGLHIGTKRLFGSKKTLRGLLTVSLLTGAAATLCTLLVGLTPTTTVAIFGFLVGLAYMLGELPNSFLKRRFNIAESDSTTGFKGFFFFTLNHTDSVLTAALALYVLIAPTRSDLILFIAAGSLAHLFVNYLLRSHPHKAHSLQDHTHQ